MNKELMKVIAGLECCTDKQGGCNMCPYSPGNRGSKCLNILLRDALRILLEVERDGVY